MPTGFRLLCLLFGLASLVIGALLYESEERALASYLAALWIKLDDSNRQLRTRFAHLCKASVLIAGRLLDRVFGARIVASRMFAVTMSFALGAVLLALANRSLVAYLMGSFFVFLPFHKRATTGMLSLLLAATIVSFVAYFFYAPRPSSKVEVANPSSAVLAGPQIVAKRSGDANQLPGRDIRPADASAQGATTPLRVSGARGPFQSRWFGVIVLISLSAVWLPAIPVCVALIALARLALRTLEAPRSLGTRILSSTALLAILALSAWTWILVPTPCDPSQNPVTWPPTPSFDLGDTPRDCDPDASIALQYLAPATAPVAAVGMLPVLTFVGLSVYLAAAPAFARLLYSLQRLEVLGNRKIMIGLGSALIVMAFAPERAQELAVSLLKQWGAVLGGG